MTTERFNQLMTDDEQNLTDQEIKEGWHFCWEFDGLLRNNNEPDEYQCDCLSDE
jgi:hypothetical protein